MRRRAHARRVQRCVLRARLPRAADGCRARRGTRPHRRRARRVRCARRAGCSESTSSTAAIDDDVPRPRGVPERLDARRARSDGGGPRRQRHDRERRRQRRRRRQGDLHLRARPHPLLPRRGADPPERRHLPPVGRGPARRRCSSASTSWWSSPSPRSGGYGMLIGPSRQRRGDRVLLRAASRRTRAATSRRRSCTSRGTRRWSATTSRAATSTSGPSCCRVSGSRSSRAGYPRRAAQGVARRELVARRRVEGHVGAAPRGRRLMLARHAESLFWMGRYIERAEDTARMLDVTYHGLLESPPEEATRAWLDLLVGAEPRAALRRTSPRGDRRPRAASSSCSTPKNSGAIVSARSGTPARTPEACASCISTELWEAVNTFWLELLLATFAPTSRSSPTSSTASCGGAARWCRRRGRDDVARRRLAVLRCSAGCSSAPRCRAGC